MKIQNTQTQIVPGRLYAWKGTVIRAGRLASNNFRHVKVHNLLHGFVPDVELTPITKRIVEAYLALADSHV